MFKSFKSFIISLSVFSISFSAAFANDGLPDGNDCSYKDSAYIMERKDGGTLMGEYQIVVFNPVKIRSDYMVVKIYNDTSNKYEIYSLDPRRVYLDKTENIVR